MPMKISGRAPAVKDAFLGQSFHPAGLTPDPLAALAVASHHLVLAGRARFWPDRLEDFVHLEGDRCSVFLDDSPAGLLCGGQGFDRAGSGKSLPMVAGSLWASTVPALSTRAM